MMASARPVPWRNTTPSHASNDSPSVTSPQSTAHSTPCDQANPPVGNAGDSQASSRSVASVVVIVVVMIVMV